MAIEKTATLKALQSYHVVTGMLFALQTRFQQLIITMTLHYINNNNNNNIIINVSSVRYIIWTFYVIAPLLYCNVKL